MWGRRLASALHEPVMMDEAAGGFLQGIMRKKVSSDMAMTTLTPLIVRTIGTFQPPLAAMTTPNVPCPTGICHYTHCGCNVYRVLQ